MQLQFQLFHIQHSVCFGSPKSKLVRPRSRNKGEYVVAGFWIVVCWSNTEYYGMDCHL